MINKIYILLKKKKKRKTTQFYYPPSLPRNFPLDLTHTWYLYTCYIFVETRKGFHLLYSKNCSLFKEQRFSSEIENRDRDRDRLSYRSSFRLRGKERRRGEEGRRGRGVYEFRFRKNPVEGNKGRASTRRQKREWASERKGQWFEIKRKSPPSPHPAPFPLVSPSITIISSLSPAIVHNYCS